MNTIPLFLLSLTVFAFFAAVDTLIEWLWAADWQKVSAALVFGLSVLIIIAFRTSHHSKSGKK